MYAHHFLGLSSSASQLGMVKHIKFDHILDTIFVCSGPNPYNVAWRKTIKKCLKSYMFYKKMNLYCTVNNQTYSESLIDR